MKDEDRYKLYYGPYHPPKVERGQRLFDEIRGTVVVGGYSDGKIVWPYAKRPGTRSLIVCGDLVKAVLRESNQAVAHWWGVSAITVTTWRMALRVKRVNDGTRERLSRLGKQPFVLARLTAVRKMALDPVRNARRARRRRKLGLLRWNERRWKPREDALLGTMPDTKLARKLGCSSTTVEFRRRRLGVKAFTRVSLRKGRAPISPRKLMARRLALRLSQLEVARRAKFQSYAFAELGYQMSVPLAAIAPLATALECRPEDIMPRRPARRRVVPDDSLLGKMSDVALARRWRLPQKTVQRRRVELGIRGSWPPLPKPLPDESLLGTRSDRQLAALWRLSKHQVSSRRRQLGIPSYRQSRQWVVFKRKLRACRKRAGITRRQVALRAGDAGDDA
jgi:transcriptional regulator with XRE-family HTH domain